MSPQRKEWSCRRTRRAVAALAAVALGATGGASARASTVDVIVHVRWDPERAAQASGVVARVQYPRSLAIATSAQDGSAKEHVDRLSGASGGLFDALVRDTDGDGTADLLSIGLVTPGIEPGDFVRIHFERAPGAAATDGSALSCVADVADGAGSVPATCSVTIAAQ